MLRRGPWEGTARAQDPGWQARARGGGGLDKDASREMGRGGRGESGTRRSQNPQDTVDSASGMRGKEESRSVHWFGPQDGQWCVCSDGKHRDSAGLGQRNGQTGWRGRGVDAEGPLCTIPPAGNTALPPPGCLQVVTQTPAHTSILQRPFPRPLTHPGILCAKTYFPFL